MKCIIKFNLSPSKLKSTKNGSVIKTIANDMQTKHNSGLIGGQNEEIIVFVVALDRLDATAVREPPEADNYRCKAKV